MEKDAKASYVVGVEHPAQTIKAGSNHQRQQSEPASSSVSMEESTLVNVAGSNPMRQQSKLQLQLTKEELTTSSFTDRKIENRKDANSVQDVPSESSSSGHLREPMFVGSATPQPR